MNPVSTESNWMFVPIVKDFFSNILSFFATPFTIFETYEANLPQTNSNLLLFCAINQLSGFLINSTSVSGTHNMKCSVEATHFFKDAVVVLHHYNNDSKTKLTWQSFTYL